MKKFKLSGIIFAICLAVICMFSGCLSTADYEEIYNDDVLIAKSTSNVRIASVQNSVKGDFNLSCASLSGVFVMVNSFTVNEDTSATLTFEVSEGKCKIVLVKGSSVYTLTEGGYEGELDFEDIPSGKYKVKAVGVDAHIKISFKY